MDFHDLYESVRAAVESRFGSEVRTKRCICFTSFTFSYSIGLTTLKPFSAKSSIDCLEPRNSDPRQVIPFFYQVAFKFTHCIGNDNHSNVGGLGGLLVNDCIIIQMNV